VDRPLYDYVLDFPEINSRFIVLDNSWYYLTRHRIDYLKTELRLWDSLKFVILHVPPQTHKWIDDHTFIAGTGAFLSGLSGCNVAGVFYGHYHLYDEDTLFRNPPHHHRRRRLAVCISGILPIHFVVVTLSGGKVSTEKVLISE